MNILHYALGFPPYRTGGLTKFCMDLMQQQAAERHTVSLLWPGAISFVRKKTRIQYHGKNGPIHSYEVLNPTPVSYDEGIVDVERFAKDGDVPSYDTFLRMLNPDVIHIHTLMGLHKALLVAAKELDIKIVFSAHDFFPICPKVTMFRKGKICEDILDCKNCPECNVSALSLGNIRILQSGLYRKLKDSYFVKLLRKQHRDNFLSEADPEAASSKKASRSSGDYLQLRSYYKSLIRLSDVIHYNSSITKSIYEQYLQPVGPKAEVIHITHSNIQDHKKYKDFDSNLRITYLGPAGGAKGFFLLRSALNKLWNDKESGRQDFCLNIYFQPAELSPYMKTHGRYNYDQLEEIFENTDVLVAPSIWYETFGYTVLEALSYGVPVIISDTVGAKDIIPEGAGIIVEDITADKLAQCIKQLNTEELQRMNAIAVKNFVIPTLASMSENILEKCYL